jgi:putative restriction endonuclease
MSHALILTEFDGLNVWCRGGQRAPHKPLLVLYALGRWQRGDEGDIPFREVDRDLTALLKEFGPPRHHDGDDRLALVAGACPPSPGPPPARRRAARR